MKTFHFRFLIGLSLLIMSGLPQAQAQEGWQDDWADEKWEDIEETKPEDVASEKEEGLITQCGEPDIINIEEETTVKFCNFYPRRIVYAKQSLDYSAKIKARQKSYNAPRKVIHEAYKEELAAYYATLGNEKKED